MYTCVSHLFCLQTSLCVQITSACFSNIIHFFHYATVGPCYFCDLMSISKNKAMRTDQSSATMRLIVTVGFCVRCMLTFHQPVRMKNLMVSVFIDSHFFSGDLFRVKKVIFVVTMFKLLFFGYYVRISIWSSWAQA